MTTSLPQRPDLDQLRHQAKDLLKAHRKGHLEVCALLRHLNRFSHASDADILSAELKLNEVQFALALEYGFSSWDALKQHIESVISNDVSLPEGWDKYVSVGQFKFVSRPFYALAPAFFNEPWLLVMCYWSLKNLTAGPLYIEVNYGSRFLDGPGGTGMSIGYLLRPRETREICTLVPIASATRPVNLKIRYEELRLPIQQLLHGGGYSWLTTGKLALSPPVHGDFKAANEDRNCPKVAEPKLARSDEGDCILEVSIGNPREKDTRLGVQTSVGDRYRGAASFAETEIVVKGGKTALVKVHYTFPSDPSDKPPLLAYCVFETPDIGANDVATIGLTKENLDFLSRGGNVLAAGSIDLLSAARDPMGRGL